MNEKEAYARLSELTGIQEKLLPFLAEASLDLTVINPLTEETVKGLGRKLDLKPGMHVMDLACGKAGLSLPMVLTYKVKLLGADLMPEFIREAWSRAEHAGLYEGCRFFLEDARTVVDKATGQWDVVLVVGAMPYMYPDMSEGVEKIKRLIKPGGKLVVGLPYLAEDGEQDPEAPQMTMAETVAFFEKYGTVQVEDDGRDGWDGYITPMKTAVTRLKESYPGKAELDELLDAFIGRVELEKQNLGFALWIVTMPE